MNHEGRFGASGKEESERIKPGWWSRFLKRLALANKKTLNSGCKY